MSYCLDTSFLIDMQRELQGKRGGAFDLMDGNPSAILYAPVTAWGEFLEGRHSKNESVCRTIRAGVVLLEITEAISQVYGELAAELRGRGTLPGANDIWIAATAIQHDLPLVTRNRGDFVRIKRLTVISY